MRLSLTRYLFLLNTVLLAAAVAVVGVLWFIHHQRVVQEDGAERAMTMAQSVAAMPAVQEGLAAEDPAEPLAPMAEAMREASDFEYIVVADDQGIRHSHPVESAIGEPTQTDPSPVLAGELWTGEERGPAGLTLRARAPVSGEDGEIIGYVSVGILTSDIDGVIAEALPVILGTLATALLLGGVGAYVISRRIRSRTHGLEPQEITELLDSREALLYAISEGVVAVDHAGRIVLANAAARELLGLGEADIGRRPEQTELPAEAHRLLAGAGPASDELIAVGDRVLVCSRRPVRLRDAEGGAVITLRDQTVLTQLTGELDGARTVTRGLRAQRHEFANRIHTVAGMLELGAVERAREYLNELSAATIRANAEVSERIGDVTLGALILAKSVQASEQGTSFEVSPMSQLGEVEGRPRDDLLLIVGNLMDNALEATGDGHWVELMVRRHGVIMQDAGDDDGGELIEVRVTDSGPGVAPEEIEQIFAAGYSTKGLPGSDRRGLGLALVRQACRRWGGAVEVETEERTVFTAHIPVVDEPGSARFGGSAGAEGSAAPEEVRR